MRRRASTQPPAEPPPWVLDQDAWATREGVEPLTWRDTPRDVGALRDWQDQNDAWRAAAHEWAEANGWTVLDLLIAARRARRGRMLATPARKWRGDGV